MKILGIEHIGIAVKDLKKRAPFWEHILGLSHQRNENVAEQGVSTTIYDTNNSKVELLQPTNEGSPVEKFIANRGEGLHHLCFEVDDIELAVTELKNAGIELINETPRVGVEGYRVVFVHPKSTGGVLVELAEKSR
ncbi:MAG: methylmalonyl-CoA epimerase [Candidatus Marinimicrobia bacterium]|nr:methylmalonyl-CoA epimerase [Candidatus Neomarinimicrobiota bacterium]